MHPVSINVVNSQICRLFRPSVRVRLFVRTPNTLRSIALTFRVVWRSVWSRRALARIYHISYSDKESSTRSVDTFRYSKCSQGHAASLFLSLIPSENGNHTAMTHVVHAGI